MVAKWLKLGIGAIEAAIDARKMRTVAPGCGGLKREGEIDTQREGEGERHREREKERETQTERFLGQERRVEEEMVGLNIHSP